MGAQVAEQPFNQFSARAVHPFPSPYPVLHPILHPVLHPNPNAEHWRLLIPDHAAGVYGERGSLADWTRGLHPTGCGH
jgi:hypothetical protein